MCFRPPTVETHKVCPKCGHENVGEGIGNLSNCEECGAELELSEMEKLQMQIGGMGAPSAPGVPGAPAVPGAPKVPGAPSVPGAPKVPSASAVPKN